MQQTITPTKPRVLNFWLPALALAWAFDLLFWSQEGGLGFPIWIALSLIVFFALAFWQKARPAPGSYALALVTLLFSITLFIRSEPMTRFIAGLFSIFGLGLLAATLTTAYWTRYRLGDYLMAALKVFAAAVTRVIAALSKAPPTEKSPAESTPARQSWIKPWLPVLRGVLLALPVVAVLAALLAAADPVFERLVSSLFQVFDIEKLPQYLFRLAYILILSYLFAGALLHAVFPEPPEPRPNPAEPWKMRFLGAVEAQIILGSVVLLFAVFLAIQFRYLFGGQANITETGFTFAEYARRGFFELVAVAVLSLMLYIGLGTITRRVVPAHTRNFSILSIALIALVLMILVSALQRLLLYETAYAYTRLRIYTHIFIPWLAALLIATIVLEWIRKPGHFGLCLLFVSIGFGLTFALINVDTLITNLDLQRARQGAELDGSHLVGLSDDAVPTLVSAYQDPTQPTQIHQVLGAVLACKQDSPNFHSTDWRSFKLPSSQASLLLSQLDLKAYIVQNADKTTSVQLNGAEFSCYNSMD